MRAGGVIRSRSGCMRKILQVVVFFLGFYLFRYELGLLWNLLKSAINLAQGLPPTGLPPADELLRQFLYIALNLFALIFLGFVLSYIIGSSVLPVFTAADRWEGASRFRRFFTGERRPVIQIKEGQLVRSPPPGVAVNGGIAFIDPNSAIVLEPLAMSARSGMFLPRVGRPGVVFIRSWEKLRGVVSLRKQSRSNPGVRALTSDGIEVETQVSTAFTLGQPPAVVKVAYVGEQQAYNLRVLKIDPGTKKITAIEDELDDEDKTEVHLYAQEFLTFSGQEAELAPDDDSPDRPPFVVDDERIMAAVYAQGKTPAEGVTDEWVDLPAQAATQVFRSLIARERYDPLYISDDDDTYSLAQRPPGEFRLNTRVKPEFATRVRFLGVMDYQFLIRKGQGNRIPAVGMRVDRRTFRISPVQSLHSSKILRQRGIKVLSAGFGELTPTDPKIRQQRIDSWRARWQQQVDEINADIERSALRIRNQAKVEARLEVIQKLRELMQQKAYTDEALTLHIFQTLEEIASQPGPSRLLPADTVRFMQTLPRLLQSAAEAPDVRQNEPSPPEISPEGSGGAG